MNDHQNLVAADTVTYKTMSSKGVRVLVAVIEEQNNLSFQDHVLTCHSQAMDLLFSFLSFPRDY